MKTTDKKHKRPGETYVKQWITETALRENRSTAAVTMRLARGNYPGVKVRRVDKGNVFVREAAK